MKTETYSLHIEDYYLVKSKGEPIWKTRKGGTKITPSFKVELIELLYLDDLQDIKQELDN